MPRPARLRSAAVLMAVAVACRGPAGGTDRAGVPPLHPSVDDYPETVLVIETASGDLRLPVKVADTAERRSHGLMEVPDVPSGTGMWFTFPHDTTGAFWMKDTLVPLDIAFVAADGTVVDVQTMTPCREDPCPTYAPTTAYRFALEVPAGWLAANDVAVGDHVVEEP